MEEKGAAESLAKGFSRAADTVDTRGTEAVVDMAMVVFGIDKSERQKLEILFEAYALENMKQSIRSAVGRKENGTHKN